MKLVVSKIREILTTILAGAVVLLWGAMFFVIPIVAIVGCAKLLSMWTGW